MKTQIIISAIAASLFAASVGATDIYHGWGQGNSDLYSSSVTAGDRLASVQPGIGSNFDRYHGFADGNQDLFSGYSQGGVSNAGSADVYKGFSGNPDLNR